MTPSKKLLYFCLSFIIGIFLSSIIKIPQTFLLGFLFFGVLLIFVPFFLKKDQIGTRFARALSPFGQPFLSKGPGRLGIMPIRSSSLTRRVRGCRNFNLLKFRDDKIIVFGFCILFLVLGISRYQESELRIKNNELKIFNDLEETIVLTGVVVREPDVRVNSQKLTIEPEIIYFHTTEYESREIKRGKILVTASKYPEYKYGDELEIKGELKAPAVFEDFNYQDYLAKQGIYSVIYWSEIKLLNRKTYGDPLSVAYAKILDFKNKLRESIYQNISPPQSSILGSMVLGDKSRMSTQLKEKLNIAGVRHITAISGMHILILSTVLMSLLIGLGFWRGQAFYFSIILISLFIIMSGAQPSSIRAGIMGGLFLLAQKVGRKSVSSRTIVITAALMLFFNPLLLLSDVGFQLSFLAAIGIIHFGPILERWLRFIPEEKLINLRSILLMTFSAYIFTLPIIIYNFGRMSLVAPLTNVLILPIIPLIMILGFISGLLGMFWGFLGFIFSFPVWFLLTYLLKVVDFFSQPWAAKTIENVHWFWLIISYLILGFLTWYLNKRQRLRFLDY